MFFLNFAFNFTQISEMIFCFSFIASQQIQRTRRRIAARLAERGCRWKVQHQWKLGKFSWDFEGRPSALQVSSNFSLKITQISRLTSYIYTIVKLKQTKKIWGWIAKRLQQEKNKTRKKNRHSIRK